MPTPRRLTPEDLPAFMASFEAMAAALPDPGGFRLFGGAERFFHDHLGTRGVSLGVFDAAGLVAYGAITRPAYTDIDNYARDAGWPAERAAHMVTLSAAFVHPRARGAGLHQQLIRARLDALESNDRDVLARAAVGNQVSRHNFFKSGFVLIWAGRQSEGSLRQVYWRPAMEAAPRQSGMPQWVHQEDIPAQQALLAKGWVGAVSEGAMIGFLPEAAHRQDWSGRRESNPPHELGKLR